MEWRLECPSGAEYIDIKFHDNFKVAGAMPDCRKDQVYVYSNGVKVGGPFCHLTAPEPMMSLSAEDTRVTFTTGTGRGMTRTGFSVLFQCRAPPTTALPPATLAPTTTMVTTRMEPTSVTPTQHLAGRCGGVVTAYSRNRYNSVLKTPGWPTQPYPLNMLCQWKLRCPAESRYIDLKFEDNFRVAGKMPDCTKDWVKVESSSNTFGPFCHLTRPSPIIFLSASDTKVIFSSGSSRGRTRTGFAGRFQCR